MTRVDIYDWPKQLEYVKRYVERGAVRRKRKTPASTVPLSPRNIELILAFDEQKAMEECSLGWRIRLMTMLVTMARILKKDFDTATKEDIRRLIVHISTSPDYTPGGKAKFRSTFKMFYKWLRYGESYHLRQEYPPEVSWIAKGLHTRDQSKLQPTDLWTEEEIQKFLEATDHPMWRALFSVLTETGARVGDICNRQIKDVYHDDYSFLIHIEGKSANPRKGKKLGKKGREIRDLFIKAARTEDPDERSHLVDKALGKWDGIRERLAVANDPSSWRNTSLPGLLYKIDELWKAFGFEERKDRQKLIFKGIESFKKLLSLGANGDNQGSNDE